MAALKLKVSVKFIEPILGTTSGNPDIFTDHMSKNCPEDKKAEEAGVIGKLSQDIDDGIVDEAEMKKKTTYFPRIDNKLFMYDYQIKGFFKDAGQALIAAGIYTKEELKKIRCTQYLIKKTIDQLVFITDRRVFFADYTPDDITYIERPLRAETMRGERIALARSEAIPDGATMEFDILLLNKNLEKFIKQCLDYGKLRGFGQWRNSGCGRFTYKCSVIAETA